MYMGFYAQTSTTFNFARNPKTHLGALHVVGHYIKGQELGASAQQIVTAYRSDRHHNPLHSFGSQGSQSIAKGDKNGVNRRNSRRQNRDCR